MRLQFVLSEMLIGLRRNLTLTLAVIVTLAVSLVLTAAGLLTRAQVGKMQDYWYNKVEVSVYLCTTGDSQPPCNNNEVTDAQRTAIGDALSPDKNPAVEHVFYESPQEAYKHFKEQFKGQPELIQSVTPATLGSSYRVKLKDPKNFDIIASQFSGQPGVAQIQDEHQILDRFFKVLSAFQKVALVTAIGAILAAIILIANTIRVAVFSRRREIGIMRLVGASNLYIELPFLLEGALTGLVGGVISLFGVVAIKTFLIDGQLKPAFRFNTIAFVGWDTVIRIGVGLTIFGMVASALVAFLTLTLSRATRV